MNAERKEQEYRALSVEIKKELISISPNLENTNRGLRPPVCDENEEYYFVSYSHKDFREVYQDIYDLQGLGVRIFYDEGGLIEGTKDWRDVAEKYISRGNCIGVVFYISENSLLSDSIDDEIKKVKELKKPYVCVNMPVKRNLLYGGRAVKGEIFCAKTLLEILCAKENRSEINNEEYDYIFKHFNEKYDYISKYFDKNILYTKFTATAAEKKQWLETLPKPPLFHFSKNELLWKINKRAVRLATVYDISIDAVEEKDYLRNDFKDPEWELVFIGACAFSNRRNLKTIYLPETVSVIEPYAFYNCHSLQSIDLTNVSSIQDSAFANCTSLKRLNIPSKAMEIGNKSFLGCAGLEEVKISSRINKLGEGVFRCCENVKFVDLAESRIERIGVAAFESCRSLTTVSLPNRLEEIGEDAFAGCENLTTIVLPDRLKAVGNGAFRGCAFSSFKLPKNVISIGVGAFMGCKNLKGIAIPGSIEMVSYDAFRLCSALKIVSIEQGVEEIADCAFCQCDSLVEICLPSSITTIMERAFEGCPKLEVIYFDGTSDEWSNVERSINWANDSGDFIVSCSDWVEIKKADCRTTKFKRSVFDR